MISWIMEALCGNHHPVVRSLQTMVDGTDTMVFAAVTVVS